jgi:hexosaminidase
MKINYLCFIILILLISFPISAKQYKQINIIPKPLSIKFEIGVFKLDNKTQIVYDNGLKNHAEFLAQYIKFLQNIDLAITEKKEAISKNTISLNINGNTNDNEEYEIIIEPSKIIVSGNPKGVFYAIQSLRQLVSDSKNIPCMKILDKPRFGYRGMHLDVSRHFMPKEFVKKYIDFLAMYKMNIFHWHLVDDQGWRLEIKKYPKLTEIGAWRADRSGITWRECLPQKPGEKTTYGGFYTQEEIKDIVKYAQDRFVTIIPEIEMPGHCLEVLAAYPQYSCTGGPFTVATGTYWPPTEAYCAGNDETFTFLQDVLTEVMGLFPGKYIHIGGDEAVKDRWKACPKCQARIKAEGLEDVNELQSYFVKRIEKFIVSKDKRIIGWDEILEGGLAPEATVMSWRGTKGGIEASKAGHDVIMTPYELCYFDYYQGIQELEPEAIGGFLPLNKVYTFEPVPTELTTEEAKHILGGQANVWSEYIPTTEHAEYMVFPRIAAMAEAVWTSKENKNWNDFISRMEKHTKLLDALKVNYARSMYNVKLTTQLDTIKKIVKVEMTTESGNSKIRYTLDGSEPTEKSTLYKVPFILNRSAKINAVNFYGSGKKSKSSKTEVVLHKGIGIKVLGDVYDKRYPGGGSFALVDGVRGSLNFGDGKWQGFEKNDFESTLDLGKTQQVNKVSIGFMQNYHFSVFLPTELEVSVSNDGKEFKAIKKIMNDIPIDKKEIFIKDFSCVIKDNVRYIQIKAKNIGVNPDSHPDKGYKSWLMVDEMVVE